MQEFNEDDKLTFERGTSRIVAKVRPGSVSVYFESLPGSADVKWMTDMGWKIASVEKAAPKLPTEPGSYVDRQGVAWTITPNGDWRSGYKYTNAREAIGFAPFTPVEPVPVTAKKVLDAIRQRIGSIDSAYDFQAVAAEFGVTE